LSGRYTYSTGTRSSGAQHRDQGPDVLPVEAVPVDTHDIAVVRSAGLRPGGAHRHQARQLCERGVQPARVALVAIYFNREVWFPIDLAVGVYPAFRLEGVSPRALSAQGVWATVSLLRKDSGLVDAPGRRVVGAKGKSPL